VHSVADLVALPLTGVGAGVVGVQAAGLSMAAFAGVAGLVGLLVAGRALVSHDVADLDTGIEGLSAATAA
jgi:hypothetical protein